MDVDEEPLVFQTNCGAEGGVILGVVTLLPCSVFLHATLLPSSGHRPFLQRL